MTATPEPPPAVFLEGLSHSYYDRRALRALSLEIPAGRLHGLVGPNGAGKTTLLKVLATLLPPQSGLVRVAGINIDEAAVQVRRKVGYLPESPALYRQLSVYELLDFCGAAFGLSPAARDTQIERVLQLVGLSSLRDELVGSLSRGLARRCGLARVLIHDPEVLLLDEPAAGLDPRARIDLTRLMRSLAETGKTIVVSSHILSELGDSCDSVTVLDRGHLRYHGPLAGLPGGDGRYQVYGVRLEREWEELGEAAGELAGVVDVQPLESAASWRVVVRTGEFDAGVMLEALVASGVGVVSFVPEQSRLNEAFLELTSMGVD